MKILATIIFLSLSVAHADQKATVTCTGANVILTERSPYWGEGSAAEQSLFVLKSVDNDSESKKTAYFLDVEQDVGGRRDCFGAGSIIFTGNNSQGGQFRLCIHIWTDKSDGSVIHGTSSGVITYHHGSLRGRDERVTCVLE